MIRQHEKGWKVYNCARGSSPLEGWHVHLRAAICGYCTGAELADSILLELLVRRSFVCGIKNKGEPDFGVREPELLDELYDVVNEGACKKAGIHNHELRLTTADGDNCYQRTVDVPKDDLEQMGASR